VVGVVVVVEAARNLHLVLAPFDRRGLDRQFSMTTVVILRFWIPKIIELVPQPILLLQHVNKGYLLLKYVVD
jgi:hypothetical protein